MNIVKQMRVETIAWDKEKLDRLKIAYDNSNGLESFVFEGQEFLRDYAKYLIEYLEDQF